MQFFFFLSTGGVFGGRGRGMPGGGRGGSQDKKPGRQAGKQWMTDYIVEFFLFSLQMLETVILFGQVSKVKPIIGMIPIPCPYNSALLSWV